MINELVHRDAPVSPNHAAPPRHPSRPHTALVLHGPAPRAPRRRSQGSCATYIGTCEVGPQEEGPLYEGRLNEGLWLVWKYEARALPRDPASPHPPLRKAPPLRSADCGSGSPRRRSSRPPPAQGRNNLNDLLEKREPSLATIAAALELDKGTPAPAVAADVLRQILVSLTALHKMGIVHRDVKPLNLIVNEEEGLLRLIDLGAAASCLNAKYTIGYAKGEGPCDPLFCSERRAPAEPSTLAARLRR